MPQANVLIIDDEADIRLLLARILKLEGYSVDTAATGREGSVKALSGNFHVCICDVRLPDANGLELTRRFKQELPALEIIQLTADGSIADGVTAIKAGAFDYLSKGDDNQRLIPLLERAAEKAKAQFQLAAIEARDQARHGFDRIVGTSAAIEASKRLARQVAATETTVLITGPTGTGKEVFAHAIHFASPRRAQNFVAVNCAAFSRELLESEMFGHVAGAFTGAIKTKKGLFEEADGGTIFLDELGEMDLGLQARLLRVLENGTFMKVGSTTEQKVDVRILAATNRDLLAESEAGRFRLDLYYRLSTFVIRLPSLTERAEDIPMLAQNFIDALAPTMNKKVKGMDRDFEQALLRHNWRGNVRELRNFVERALILAEDRVLTARDIPPGTITTISSPNPGLPPSAALSAEVLPAMTLSEVERLHIERVMTMTGNNKSRAAELLGIGLTTLYRKLEEYSPKA